jgi:phage gpG-like protein
MKFLKDPIISGESIYYLSMDQSLNNTSGKFFNLTILEKPAWHSTKIAKKGKKIWDLTTSMTDVNIEYGCDTYEV